MDDIEWEDPPPAHRRGPAPGGSVRAFVETLKEHPGKWAVYRRNSNANSAGGFKQRFPGTEWVSRKTGEKTADVYARWVGDV